MSSDSIVFHLFLIFSGAAVFATLALFARQAMIVAYIFVGLLLGSSGLQWVPDSHFISDIAHIGIIFLLFLLGLNLHPQRLYQWFGNALKLALFSGVVFALTGFLVGFGAGFTVQEALVVGAAMMFSSTIIGLKLLPTSVLHHGHLGSLMISILLMQDIIAIVCLLLLHALAAGAMSASQTVQLLLALPVLVGVTKVAQEQLIDRLLKRFSTIREYIFLLAIGWCLGIAELASWMGLSAEMGAFVAGVSIAAGPIATYIAESLKPLRDFFLVLFFFALGAGVQLQILGQVLLPGLVLAGLLLWIKPWFFYWLLKRVGEPAAQSKEIGVRLGQASEFSLLISVVAVEQGVIRPAAAYLIQVTVLLTFLVSPYVIVLRYPTPIAVDDRLRRD